MEYIFKQWGYREKGMGYVPMPQPILSHAGFNLDVVICLLTIIQILIYMTVMKFWTSRPSCSPASGQRQRRTFGSQSLIAFAQRSGIKQINMPDWHLFPDYMQQINTYLFKRKLCIILASESLLKLSHEATQSDLS